MVEHSNIGQRTEATLSMLCPTDSKAAITCSGGCHLNHRRKITKISLYHFVGKQTTLTS